MLNFFKQWVKKAIIQNIKGDIESIEVTITIHTSHDTYNVDLMGVQGWDERVEISNNSYAKLTIHKGGGTIHE